MLSGKVMPKGRRTANGAAHAQNPGLRRQCSGGALALSLTLLAFESSAQVAEGVMRMDAATSGTTDVAAEGFATSKAEAESKDATEVKIVAGGLWATGNSRSVAATALGSARTRRGSNEFNVALAANYGRAAAPDEPMRTNVENLQGKLRYDRFLSGAFATFVLLSGRRDRFQGLDLRVNLDPGFAYSVIDQEKQQLAFEAGYDLQFDLRRQETLDAAPAEGAVLDRAETYHSIRAFTGYRNSLNEHVTFNAGLEYLQGLRDTDYWRLNWDVGLTAAIASRFSLATTFALRFDHHPLPNVERLDTVSAINVVYQLL